MLFRTFFKKLTQIFVIRVNLDFSGRLFEKSAEGHQNSGISSNARVDTQDRFFDSHLAGRSPPQHEGRVGMYVE